MSTIEFANALHEKALEVVGRFKQAEIELIEILEQVEEYKTFYALKYTSLFHYATDGLKLSSNIAYVFINVARKTRQVPALKEEIKAGRISITKAKKITPVLSQENQNHWLELARNSSKQQLERHVAISSPLQAIPDKMDYVSADRQPVEQAKILKLDQNVRVQLQVGVSEKLMLRLRRAQDVLSQKKRRSVGLEEVLDELTSAYLSKEDPIEKAQRQKIRGRLQQVPGPVFGAGAANSAQVPSRAPCGQPIAQQSKRRPIKAQLNHQMMLKYSGQCGYVDENGKRCTNRRFLEKHHIQSVANGGRNELENLELLCSGHHKLKHWK